MRRKLFAVLTAVTLCFSMYIPVMAAEGTNSAGQSTQSISGLKTEMEQKYSIQIRYPKDDNGEARISAESLLTLDMALMNATPAVVRQISRYYSNNTGSALTFSFVYHDMDVSQAERGLILAGFDPSLALIEIYLPINNSRAYVSGENPVTILHEFGHAVQIMMTGSTESQSQIEIEWKKLNGKLSYGVNSMTENVNPRVFVSAYASSAFAEDFAETFALALCGGRDGLGLMNQLYKDGQQTRLATKLNDIIQRIPNHFSNSQELVANLQKAFTSSTVYQFEGISFSGGYLQYRGYPQPKNIYRGLVAALELSVDEATWVRDLGAWRVTDTNGKEFFLFPGGTWCNANEMRRAA